jgi:Uma2 family endonuclease
MSLSYVPDVRMNVEEFLAWSARQPDQDHYELVDGEIVAMTRDTIQHNRAKGAAYRALWDAVRAAGLPCEVFIDGIAITVNENTVRIPDVIVECGVEPRPAAMVADSPLVVVEVVSRSSERDDVDTKFMDYFSVAGIRHYLILFPERRAVVHHQRSEQGKIESAIVNEGEIVLDPPGISVSVAALLGSI